MCQRTRYGAQTKMQEVGTTNFILYINKTNQTNTEIDSYLARIYFVTNSNQSNKQ